MVFSGEEPYSPVKLEAVFRGFSYSLTYILNSSTLLIFSPFLGEM